MYSRLLNLPELLKKKSFFFFGPRATGKSTLIRMQLLRQDAARIRLRGRLETASKFYRGTISCIFCTAGNESMGLTVTGNPVFLRTRWEGVR
jgi:hypothetical protein